jgi:CRISPR-associated protein Cas1
LERVGASAEPIRYLETRIRSGDPNNIEAQAAQKYLPAFFGSTFRRDREAEGVNAALNYGYTVLRAATARSILGAGLHPSLGLHHKSKGNALRLADDLMEPFRPTVDLVVHALEIRGAATLEPPSKRKIAGILHSDFKTDDGVSTLSNALTRLAQSLAQVFLGERKTLAWPMTAIPLEAAATDGGA